MKSVFIGGSRAISHIPPAFQARLDNIAASDLVVLVGDAAGADCAIQEVFASALYPHVAIFCAGPKPRHNIGAWPVRTIKSSAASGFQFHAAKDRAMANEADFGLMLWDGVSPGTILNVRRLTHLQKPTVLMNLSDHTTIILKSAKQWEDFLRPQPSALKRALNSRMTSEERTPAQSDLTATF